MKKEAIPQEIKTEVIRIVNKFNEEDLDLINDFYKYTVEFKGKYIYINTSKYGRIAPVGRLTFSGDINDMDFAIYKYSSDSYDPDETFFPGFEYVDGTVMGALNACNTAYPPM